MSNKITSSVEFTRKVKCGGIKKKSQIKALNTAESKTGRISNVTAIKETVTNKMNAATL